MPKFVVDYAYKIPEWASIEVYAKDKVEAEVVALEEIKRDYPDTSDIVVETVVELPPNG